MQKIPNKRVISNSFNKLHEDLSRLRLRLEMTGDETVMNLYDSMEKGLLAPMRRLRLHMSIPYDWNQEAVIKRNKTFDPVTKRR